ncbi:hypothetical protein FA15DRAFT_669284 [Coprinopsis marcescibilis]|uniref:Crinkler effector protein N-terminal domain-containing protein n=1 Tax=Coprinopsis marcescibilis TaxID=230819 RepID=A0A5C3KWA0_COPMA|nr:hypothetical protein FA15DRAFT_669284 [Coprinopsis marcescibilis]
MTQPLITLNCLVSGDRAKQVFPISIAPNKTVSILKKLIKLNYPHYFANINITDIQLVKVSLPLDEAPKAQEPSTVEGSEKIELPLKTISTVFNEPPLKDHVHIIVVKPTVQEANSASESLLSVLPVFI